MLLNCYASCFTLLEYYKEHYWKQYTVNEYKINWENTLIIHSALETVTVFFLLFCSVPMYLTKPFMASAKMKKASPFNFNWWIFQLHVTYATSASPIFSGELNLSEYINVSCRTVYFSRPDTDFLWHRGPSFEFNC